MTPSTKPVTRLTTALVRDRGLRPVVATISGGVIELRAKGLRSRYTLDLGWCYRSAVTQHIAELRALRRAARRTKR